MDLPKDDKKVELPFLKWRENTKYSTPTRTVNRTWSSVYPQIQKNKTKWKYEIGRVRMYIWIWFRV